MNEPLTTWENRIHTVASTLPYPPTPDVAAAVREKLEVSHGRQHQNWARLAWMVLLALVVTMGLLAVPQVRAAVLRFFQIGAITIFETGSVIEPTADVPQTPDAEQPVTAVPEAILPATATPLPLYAPLTFTDFTEPMTWEEAQANAPFTLRLPTYPADLGEPNRMYGQESTQGQTFIFTWQDPEEDEERVWLALYEIWGENFAWKQAENIQQTAVHGREAIWVDGPHLFQLQNGRVESWQFVAGSVLVWWANEGITYRLEGAESLAEAIRIAESLTAIEE